MGGGNVTVCWPRWEWKHNMDWESRSGRDSGRGWLGRGRDGGPRGKICKRGHHKYGMSDVSRWLLICKTSTKGIGRKKGRAGKGTLSYFIGNWKMGFGDSLS